MPTTKFLAALAIASSVAGGGAVGALLGVPTLTGAQEGSTSTTTAPTSTSTADGCDADRPPEGGRHRFGHHLDLAVAADALGVTDDELRDALDTDTSIADVATENDVDIQTVIDALVADATADIDAKVDAGDLDADQAAELKADLTERITDIVNHDGFGPGGPGMGRHRMGGPGMGSPGFGAPDS